MMYYLADLSVPSLGPFYQTRHHSFPSYCTLDHTNDPLLLESRPRLTDFIYCKASATMTTEGCPLGTVSLFDGSP